MKKLSFKPQIKFEDMPEVVKNEVINNLLMSAFVLIVSLVISLLRFNLVYLIICMVIICSFLIFYYFSYYKYLCDNKIICFEGVIEETYFISNENVPRLNLVKKVKNNVEKRYKRSYYFLKIDEKTKLKIFYHKDIDKEKNRYKSGAKIVIATIPSCIHKDFQGGYSVNRVFFTDFVTTQENE